MSKFLVFSVLSIIFLSGCDWSLYLSHSLDSNEKLALDGAYEYYLVPVNEKRGKYFAEQDFPRFITESKLKDLTDPLFADRD